MVKVIAIFGTGPSLEMDAARLVALKIDVDRMVINRAAWHAETRRFSFWTSAHPEEFAVHRWQFKHDFRFCSDHAFPGVDIIYRGRWYTCGGSGMLATLIALEVLGYSKVILCGIPLDAGAYLHNYQADDCWPKISRAVFNGRVRSFSGNTRELLREPDLEWLQP